MMNTIKIKNSSEEIPVGKIVCVGRNYAEHIKEMGSAPPKLPMYFMKPASTLINSGEKIVHPDYSNNMHHEVELVLLIGETIKDADDTAADKAIIGYGVGLDMTLRDLQKQCKENGTPWEVAKSFDTCAVVSEFVLKNYYKLLGDEKITLSVNDEVRQNSSLKHMIFSPVEIVKYISSRITLHKGDLIYTGTPEGVGKVERCNVIKASIEGIGYLESEVV